MATRTLVAVFGCVVIAAVACACGDRSPATVTVLDVSASRLPDGRIDVLVGVEASEQSGGDVGPYCVSAHWLIGDPSFQPPAPAYFGELDSASACQSGLVPSPGGAPFLSDGAVATIHLVSTRTDLPPGTPLRGQAVVGRTFTTEDASNP